MSRRNKVSSKTVNEYTTVHPVLDFYDGKAVIAVGGKWQHDYDNGDVEFSTSPVCVLSTGEQFEYSKKALAERGLFWNHYIDVQPGRWNYEDIEQWCADPNSFALADLFKIVESHFRYYMDFQDKQLYTLLSCFVIYTYFYPLFSSAPVLQFWGEFKTGKTKILSLLEAMAFNPINSANISNASVFRLVQSRRAVILLDESEDLTGTDKGKEIRNMLLAGTGKSGETFRQEKTVDDSFTTQSFQVFSPKVIANIKGIETPALKSRTIRITTVGAADKEKENRDVDQGDPRWIETRNYLYRYCMCHFNDIVDRRFDFPEHGLSGRTLSIWRGILTIASLVGKFEWEQMLLYAKENKDIIDAEAEEEEWRPKQIIGSLLVLMDKRPGQRLFTPEELMLGLGITMDFSSKHQMGLSLGRLGIYSKPTTRDSEKGRYYYLDKGKILTLQQRR